MTSPVRRNPRVIRAPQATVAGVMSTHRTRRCYRREASPLLMRLLARLWQWLDVLLRPAWRALKLRRLAGAMALSGLAVLGLGALAPAQAQVKGTPQVVNGQANFLQSGKTLTITNTPGTIINWQQFNIGRDELTRFVQQNAASQVLNRVVGVNPSEILGKLQSNGRVFLVNPNGIVFGAGSQVDVAGLVASTLKLSNEDFLNNRLRFGETPGAGAVRNEGSIRTSLGGEVLLVAPRVENSGLIMAPEGKILLAAGRSVEVADIDKPSIRVEISNSTEEAVNLGTLMSKHISIYGGLVKNSGRIQANSAIIGENGKVVLRGKAKVELTPSSDIEALGASAKGAGTTGGEIDISAENSQGINGGGEVVVQGRLSVKPLLESNISVYESASEQKKVFVQQISPQSDIDNIAKTGIFTTNFS